MTSASSTPLCEKTEKSLTLAKLLFPDEEWISFEPNIWVAKSRLPQKEIEPKKWVKEMSQVKILTNRGSVAFFLPELLLQDKKGSQSADLVLDGEIVEMKTIISDSRETLGGKFRKGYKQGALLLQNSASYGVKGPKEHSVFIRLLADISVKSVKAKIAGVLKYHPDNGKLICYFEKTGELHTWTYDELRAIIGTAPNTIG